MLYIYLSHGSTLTLELKTCFYDGMDALQQSMVAVCVPSIYLGALVGLMVLVSHFSHTICKAAWQIIQFLSWQHSFSSHTQRYSAQLITALYTTYLEYPTWQQNGVAV